MDYDGERLDLDGWLPELDAGSIEPPPTAEEPPPERPPRQVPLPAPSTERVPFLLPIAIFALVNVQPLWIMAAPVRGGEALVYLFSVMFLSTIGALLWLGRSWVGQHR